MRARLRDHRADVVHASTWKVTLSAPDSASSAKCCPGRRPSGGSRCRRRASWIVRRDRAQHDRPDRHRRDEVAVADVEVEDARTGVSSMLELLAETRRSRPRRPTARSRRSASSRARPRCRSYARRRAMKKPLVRWTCGSVSRNSGRRRMPELRPALDRLDLEPRRVDDGLGLVRVERADGVDDRAAGADALGRRPQQLELELRQRVRAPAQVGARGEDAEAGAGRVDERAVEARSARAAARARRRGRR